MSWRRRGAARRALWRGDLRHGGAGEIAYQIGGSCRRDGAGGTVRGPPAGCGRARLVYWGPEPGGGPDRWRVRLPSGAAGLRKGSGPRLVLVGNRRRSARGGLRDGASASLLRASVGAPARSKRVEAAGGLSAARPGKRPPGAAASPMTAYSMQECPSCAGPASTVRALRSAFLRARPKDDWARVPGCWAALRARGPRALTPAGGAEVLDEAPSASRPPTSCCRTGSEGVATRAARVYRS